MGFDSVMKNCPCMPHSLWGRMSLPRQKKMAGKMQSFQPEFTILLNDTLLLYYAEEKEFSVDGQPNS